ncbi:nicotinamide riboside transporter PnuC [Coraliomargarita akajimensis]|uniref:Nicotinamide riboside transporter PnuC n=1 Tax=Coraliomargarita akajimensis (strain DSM 45221 / IAM 15411 / JCM 23193 / KCTC 12865 / 04OKA010-24) TaxID=583355 RepID=D5EMU2_CORAD|nr:nicotinamide riboside transporter PnuC [Coraliomargarita akajimensis]ADE55332.1 nicotinamide mononucleotide transporter PnuC [Coraliomargarita akajimensis DSM 45221]
MLETVTQQIANTHWVEWLGTATGVIGVALSIKERIAAWPLFIVCYSCYVYLSIDAALYAALLMNSVFILISIYGWTHWAKQAEQGDAPRIRHIERHLRNRVLLFIPFGAILFGSALHFLTPDAYFPYFDALAMSSAFTAQWMLSKKYIENWLCWIIADIIYVVLWSSQGYWLSAGLFTAFIVLATRGWFEWRTRLRRP